MLVNIQIDESALAALRDRFSGLLLRPGDAAYDDVRRVHNGMIDRRPALIARCTVGPRQRLGSFRQRGLCMGPDAPESGAA